jgi:hypothetical protein
VTSLTAEPKRSLGDLLYPEPAERTAPAIVKWWEKRRLFYNLVVGSVGLVTLAITMPVVSFLEGRLVLGPLLGALAFGVLANVCYTFGSVVEILIDKIWGRAVRPAGPPLYRMGLTFSIGLALLPNLLVVFVALIRIFVDSNFP